MNALLSRMSVRERWFVLGAGVFLFFLLIYALVLSPVLENKRRYARMAQDAREDLQMFRQFAAEYRSLQSSLAEVERRVSSRKTDMSLLAVMESNARKLGLADRIASMKPFSSELESGMLQSSVEMRVEKVDLNGLVRFIQAVEGAPSMAVTTRLRIKARFDDPALLDATLLLTTLEKR